MASNFMTNAAAFTEAFGVRHAPTIVWLSLINWDDDDRGAFIKSITGKGASSASVSVEE